jgi:BirA family biotin operon repressor/biotin-[acetyl-CoA-carboxylase] ligase
VVGAAHQPAGRGRRGRAWVAEPGGALLFSVVLTPPLAPIDAGMLPIVVAVALADALEAAGIEGVEIAWPNDVLVGGRKIAGILCELSAEQDHVAWAVAGVGLNVRPVPHLEEMRWPPVAVADLGPVPHRSGLLGGILRALSRRYAAWLDAGPADALGAFARHDHLVGREVRLAMPSGEIAGEAVGLDDLGRLRLRTPDGMRLLASGEVTKVRR